VNGEEPLLATALLTWIITGGFAWLWWRCLQKGAVHHYGVVYERRSDPTGFWVSMSLLMAAILFLAGCAGMFTLAAAGIV